GRDDLPGICASFYNALESVTAADYPVIGALKERMLQKGALGALMSGSGPTVFGCFKTKAAAAEAFAAIKKDFPAVKEIFLTRSL
ncbi:MAG: 4-(cytidine 5'-diphospho)-2-C-methyl-D-erythritol kinase, partial [Clostridiales bacterium]|nr:4-(cytidine 5'-diphospho)-2-C-methyl-D-erythritol kinase [Clostridiales bacterium]